MTELKLVKNARLENENGLISIRHYDTIIYTYYERSQTSTCLLDCSVTSNKQIQMANDFFKPKKIEAEHNKEKWSYHT